MQNEIDDLLVEIELKSEAIKNMGKQLYMISDNIYMTDMFIIAILNRTYNLNCGFVNLMRSRNFISAAPLVRLSLDSLLRLFASRITEYDSDSFALKVLSGESIRNMKSKITKKRLFDKYLVEELSEVDGFSWVTKVYEAGSSFIHMSDRIMFSSQKVTDIENRKLTFTIGLHDSFIPEEEKHGAAFWMDKISNGIIQLVQIWFYEKAKMSNFNIENLNELNK